MTAPIDNPTENGRPDLKELTVMILFAGDNDLAALLVSQVKAVKDAGFHENVDVVLHIDPSERGVPTRLLHVNRKRRERKVGGATVLGTSIGPTSSFVRNMGEDALSPEELRRRPGKFAKEMAKSLEQSDSFDARKALETFLGYCHENHSAKNYILILFGHGLVVGNDTFLIDEKPRSGITLPDLGKLLQGFSDEVKKRDDAVLHLVGMHSCAMSAVEVAYELRGAAGYMIGAEGIAYVGGWPYLNLMVKIFKALKDAQKKKVPLDFPDLVDKFYFHTLHNGTDFVYMGYSLDLTLCSLDPERYKQLTAGLKGLVAALKVALGTERGKEMILLAHLKAQSYWDENYTDLYDFCLCLERGCNSLLGTLGKYAVLLGKEAGSAEVDAALQQLSDVAALSKLAVACGKVRGQLELTRSVVAENGHGPIVRSDNIGSQYQYSHGLSVYFPWSEPLDDKPLPPPPLAIQSQQLTQPSTAADTIKIYEGYAFSREEEFGEDSWLSFLKAYFKATKRKSRWVEERYPENLEDEAEEEAKERFKSEVLAALPPGLAASHAVGSLEKATGGTEKPTGGSGSTCTCPSIKNYPTDKLTLSDKMVRVKHFFVTDGLFATDESAAWEGEE